ncbi:MAG: PEP-CTERM sorting domain-containing protein [Phycisphaeraceae bacterium]
MSIRKSLMSKLSLVAAAAVLSATGSVFAITYGETGGVVTGEADVSPRRTAAAGGDFWQVVPDEGPSAGTLLNARDGKFVQVLPDGGAGNGGPTNPASIEYDLLINTVGTYRLFVRWDGNATNSGTAGSSDSLFVDIVQFKDGGGGVADWYELGQTVDGDFATLPWDAGGGFEENVAGPANSSMLWAITSPGVYTLRFSTREDASAIDAFVLQLNSLAAPTGVGPLTSGIIPEPATAMLGLMGLAGLARRRRARA